MKKEDVLYALDVYEKIIKTQVFNPKELINSYKRLLGIEEDVLVNQKQAKSFLFNFFYYKRHLALFPELGEEPKQIDVPEIEKISDVAQDDDKLPILQQIMDLQKQKELSEDSNEKRSLSMKIINLKKKLENE